MKKSIDRNIIFYDGYCGFCDSVVGFIVDHDKKGALFFAPLQGDLARQLLPATYTRQLDTMVLRRNDGEVLVRSEAALAILRVLGGSGRFLAGCLDLLPKSLLERGYKLIARHRKGLKITCPVASQERRLRFEARLIKL